MGEVRRRLLARGKQALPQRALRQLLTVRSRLGEGPRIGLPTVRRPVVVVAHPDDESLAFGGTLRLLADRGSAADVVYLTDGDATKGAPYPRDEVARRRRAEAQAACELLGVGTVTFLGLPDGHVREHVHDASDRVGELVRDGGYDLVLTTWPFDGHDDHRAANEVACAAAHGVVAEVWSGEIWTPLVVNRLVDISRVVDVKAQALGLHRTAALTFDLQAMIGINRYRSVHGLLGSGHAEAFLAAAPSELDGLRAAVTEA